MAASTITTANFNNSSDANFRTWVAAVIAAIVAGGWVQTSDTGQINTSTVTAPAAANTSQGYAVFRSNDAGGSLVDYYMKLEFGSTTGAANRPNIWATVGWASDGAGNLVSTTYPVSTRSPIGTLAIPSGASISINFGSGSGYFVMAATSSTGSEDLIFSVERTRDVSVNFQNQVLLLGWSGAALAVGQVTDRSNAYPTFNSTANCFVIPQNTMSPVAAKAGLGLIFGFAPGNTSPSINIFGVEISAIGVYQDTVNVPILNSNHSYKIQRDVLFGGLASTCLLTRFE